MPFSDIPHQSKLSLDHLRDPLSLKRYYPNAVASSSEVSAFIPEVLANYKTDRDALCDALADLNSQIGPGEKTVGNIALLRDAKTVAVVTGQQAGLFTGPLYTIYKALSAIKMSEELNVAGFKAVPVFWVATEDHDFDEVSHAWFLNNNGDLFEADHHPAGYVKSSPVGNVKIDGSISKLIADTFDVLPHTELSDEVRRALGEAWAEGEFFGKAFAKCLATIFSNFGLIVIDPMHLGIKSLSSPIYAEAIKKSSEIVAGIRQNNSDLENGGYHAQVLVEDDYFPLFRIDDEGRRVALRKTGDGVYTSKEEKREFSLAELTDIANDDPQRFSPGVMVRPVVQDYLLPTVCYFGGAAEIAYFAQNSAVYKVLVRPVTPILHRQSFTVVESKPRRSLDKYGLDFHDLFAGFDRTVEAVGMKRLSSETLALLAQVETTFTTELDHLEHNFSQIDPTLTDNLEKRRRKIMYHLAALKKKANLAGIRKDETMERQIRLAFNALLPRGELQERVLNVHSFLNSYGPYFIERIYAHIDLDDKGHRVIDL